MTTSLFDKNTPNNSNILSQLLFTVSGGCSPLLPHNIPVGSIPILYANRGNNTMRTHERKMLDVNHTTSTLRH